jgi:hypothetical protein
MPVTLPNRNKSRPGGRAGTALTARNSVVGSAIRPASDVAEINAAGASVPEPPIPGDYQRREQQHGNNFFRV